jgi:hypothetical protein
MLWIVSNFTSNNTRTEMTTPKETYNYCEELIEEEINSWIIASHLYTQGEGLANFKQELKDLYKHLENIQNMKTNYLSGR